MGSLVTFIQLGLQILIFAIFARSLLTWFPIDRNGPVIQVLDAITEPILQPLRRVIPLVGALDITPMVAILLLYFMMSALGRGSF
jgi:YggT family protein